MSLFRVMHSGDLERPFNPVLYEDGVPVNMTGATSVKISINGGALKTASGNAVGQVTYNWAAGDLPSAGTYKVLVKVEWTSGRTQTFPEDGSFIIKVI